MPQYKKFASHLVAALGRGRQARRRVARLVRAHAGRLDDTA